MPSIYSSPPAKRSKSGGGTLGSGGGISEGGGDVAASNRLQNYSTSRYGLKWLLSSSGMYIDVHYPGTDNCRSATPRVGTSATRGNFFSGVDLSDNEGGGV